MEFDNMILALLNKPRGRGKLRAWDGFEFDTEIQGYVEDFMIWTHHSRNYFLLDPSTLAQTSVGNYIYKNLWVNCTRVKVINDYNSKEDRLVRSYTIY
jgi:hypothetical protein